MFYKRCQLHGVDAIYDEAENMAHVYMTIFQGYHDQADRAVAVMASFVATHLRQKKGGGIRRSKSLGNLAITDQKSERRQGSLQELTRNPNLTTPPAATATYIHRSTTPPVDMGREMKSFLSSIH